jgi:LPXTG-motif cell wall-anchored protein
MKKQLKRIGALALALVFALCLMLPAFAEGDGTTSEVTQKLTQTTNENSGNGSITIKSAQQGKTYDIYRILDLTLSEKSNDETTGNVTYNYAYKMNSEWEDFFFPTGEDSNSKYITTVEPTDDIVPLTYEDKQYYIVIDDAATFAQAALEYATSLTTNDGTKTATADGDLKFSDIALGYYLVYPQGAAVKKDNETIDANGSICSLTSTAQNADVYIKAEYPTIEKSSDQENEVVGIGDNVDFTIKGTVPDTTGYEAGTYVYTIKDTMSDGLSFNANSLKVEVVNPTNNTTTTDITENFCALVTKEDNKDLESTFELTINNVDQLTVGYDIVVTYTATVTAVATSDNLKNSAQLTYSNGPNASGDGKTAKSTGDDVRLYIANIQVYAYTGDASSEVQPDTALKGATYVLKNEDGKYYQLQADGTFKWVDKEENPTKLTTEADGFTGGLVTTDATEENDTTTQKSNVKVANDSFKGLGAGTYTLEEIGTPAGYNQATSVTFTVGKEVADDGTVKVTASDGGILIDKAYTYQYNFNHKTGTVLPSTGGMGTKLFYIIGAALVIGAGVLLVVRRRMGEEE